MKFINTLQNRVLKAVAALAITMAKVLYLRKG